jgi:hypothetical protein
MENANKTADRLFTRLCKYKEDSLKRAEEKKKKQDEIEIQALKATPAINKDKYYQNQTDSFFVRLEKNRAASQRARGVNKDINNCNNNTANKRTKQVNTNRVASTARSTISNKNSSNVSLIFDKKIPNRCLSSKMDNKKDMCMKRANRNASQEKIIKKEISSNSIVGVFSTDSSSPGLNKSQYLNEKESEIFRELFLKKYGKAK